jgi:hypothetical protein
MTKFSAGLMAEWKVLRNAISISGIHHCLLAQTAETFSVFSLCQVPAACVRTQNLASGGNFKPLGYGLLRFDAFGTSHKSIQF